LKYATAETLRLSPLPCWKDLSEDRQRERVAGLVHENRGGGRCRARENRLRAARPRHAVQAQQPQDQPNQSKKSPAPLFHAASQAVCRELYEAYAWFVGCFRQAAEKWKAGDLTASFPSGSFPPGRTVVAV
jgi:hypothetical protein